MFKRLLLLSLTLSCCAISLKAQDTLARYIPDHITRKGSYACGTTADYIASKGVASGGGSSGAPGIIVPSLFPSAAIDTCGVFRAEAKGEIPRQDSNHWWLRGLYGFWTR